MAQVIAARGRKAEAREREVGAATEQAQALINRYQITSDKLTFPALPSIPMYLDPVSNETWSGKGNAPLWAKNKPLEQFLNPAWVAKKAKEDQAKAQRKAKTAERAAKKAEKGAATVNKCREQIANTDAKQVEGAASQFVVTDGHMASNDTSTTNDGAERNVSEGETSMAVAIEAATDVIDTGSNALNESTVSSIY
ncbi:hypothetical protein WL98_01935 [Burkholderia multivorans]|nr:hypothetical protein WL98_01935 [Burkholderia multivorans]